jgi:hypothetical protein
MSNYHAVKFPALEIRADDYIISRKGVEDRTGIPVNTLRQVACWRSIEHRVDGRVRFVEREVREVYRWILTLATQHFVVIREKSGDVEVELKKRLIWESDD